MTDKTTETETETTQTDPLAEFAGKTPEEMANEILTLRGVKEQVIGEKRTLSEKYKGIDPEAYQTLLSEKQAREADEQSKQSDLDKITRTYTTEKGSWETKEKGYLAELRDLKVDSVLKSAIAENEGNELFLLPHLKGRVELRDVEGKMTAVVLDEEGQVAEGKKIADLVADFRKDDRFAAAFKSPIKAGSNAKTSAKTVGGINPWAKETVNWSEQGRIEAENPALAAQLKAAAGVK